MATPTFYGNVQGGTVNGTTGALTGTLSMGSPFTFRNVLVNGGMAIDQRNNGASITPTTGQYSVDRWCASLTAASKFTLQQTAVPSADLALGVPSGYYLTATSSSAYTVGSTDSFRIIQLIEANNVQSFAFGQSNARTVTVSFWAKTGLIGPVTFGGNLSNYAQTRFYPFSFTIPSANTPVLVSVTIPGDIGGTWVLSGNGGSMSLQIDLGTGSTYQGTGSTWTGSTILAPTGSTNLVATNAATLSITGVQLEQGSVATPFETPPYSVELARCQRYFASLPSGPLGAGYIAGPTGAYFSVQYPEPMRAAPSLTATGSASNYSADSASNYIGAALPALSGNSATNAFVFLSLSGAIAGGSVLLSSGGAALQFSAEF